MEKLKESMQCLAAGYVGDELQSCLLPHGHEGECDWKVRRATDDQLRAEYERRGLAPTHWAYEQACSALRQAKAGQEVLRADREEWKHRAELTEGLNATHGKAIRSIYRLCVKHGMAEATEKPLEWLASALAALDRYRRTETKEVAAAAPRLCAVCGRPADVCRAAPRCGEGLERGPGIANRPATIDNDGHWLDPLDLLADDA